MAGDFLDELERDRTARNSKFPHLVAEALWRRKLARKLTKAREKRALTQTEVAARMKTSASVISKLEAGGDVKMSTLQRYCTAIGVKLPLSL